MSAQPAVLPDLAAGFPAVGLPETCDPRPSSSPETSNSRTPRDLRNLHRAASAPRCAHIRVSGERCGSPALRGKDRCYYHQTVSDRKPGQFIMPVLEDGNAIQFAMQQLIEEIAADRIDHKTARLLMKALSIASANLRNTTTQPDLILARNLKLIDARSKATLARTLELIETRHQAKLTEIRHQHAGELVKIKHRARAKSAATKKDVAVACVAPPGVPASSARGVEPSPAVVPASHASDGGESQLRANSSCNQGTTESRSGGTDALRAGITGNQAECAAADWAGERHCHALIEAS